MATPAIKAAVQALHQAVHQSRLKASVKISNKFVQNLVEEADEYLISATENDEEHPIANVKARCTAVCLALAGLLDAYREKQTVSGWEPFTIQIVTETATVMAGAESLADVVDAGACIAMIRSLLRMYGRLHYMPDDDDVLHDAQIALATTADQILSMNADALLNPELKDEMVKVVEELLVQYAPSCMLSDTDGVVNGLNALTFCSNILGSFQHTYVWGLSSPIWKAL